MAASDTTPNGNHDLPFAKTLFEGADRLRGSPLRRAPHVKTYKAYKAHRCP